MSFFIRNGNTYRIAANDSLDIQERLPLGNYTVQEDMHGNLFLQTVDSFEAPKKLYGNTAERAHRILNTYRERTVSTGVMLAGEKGSGKTLLAKTLSIYAAEFGIPTIIINNAFVGDKFNKLIQDIDQECVIIFDEFEKVYDEKEQEQALTLLDGVYPSKKLFIITCNNKWRVNEHMRNRPGRIYYMIDYKGLDTEFIREYCHDNLKAVEHIDRIAQLAALYTEFNFDMLKALIEEMNRYNETPTEALQMLNAKPEYNDSAAFNIDKILVNGVEVKNTDSNRWHGNPLTKQIVVTYDPNPKDSDSEWLSVCFYPNDIKKVDADSGTYTYVSRDGNVMLKIVRVKEEHYRYMDV